MTFIRLVLCLTVACLQGACAPQARTIFFHQTSSEMLESVRLLTQLEGETRLRDYEYVFGGKLLLSVDSISERIPLQTYELAGSTSDYGVQLELHAMGSNPNTGKAVIIHLYGLSKLTCIPMSDLETFASTYYEILRPTEAMGFTFIPRERRADLIVGASRLQTPTGTCVGSFVVAYSPKSNLWGH